jgi:hypothetical protein
MREARYIRLPGLLDLVVVEDPEALSATAAHPTLDRRFGAQGPLLNRIIGGRIARILSDGRTPLAALSPRALPGRAEAQARLGLRLSEAAQRLDPTPVAEIAALLLRSAPYDALGIATQSVVGRLFRSDYVATPTTWSAALLLEEAARSINPLRWLRWRLTGEVAAAQRCLAEAASGDRLALHGTAVAVHSLLKSLKAMGDLARGSRALTAEEAVTASLLAPEIVLRQAESAGGTADAVWRTGTLVQIKLGQGAQRTLRRDLAFLREGWSHCPAHGFVPALLAAVWTEAMRQAAAQGAADGD